MEQSELKKINEELIILKKAVFEIQEYLEDCFLTNEEEAIIESSLDEFEKGETTSLENLEKEIQNVED